MHQYQSAEYEDLNDAVQSALITKSGTKEQKDALKYLKKALTKNVDPNNLRHYELDAIGSITRRNDFDPQSVREVVDILFDAGLKLRPENFASSDESINSIAHISDSELQLHVSNRHRGAPATTVSKEDSHFLDRIIPPFARNL